MAKRFDSVYPFRLVISVTKGGDTGDALSMMAQGIIIAYKTEEDARAAQDKYHRAATKVADYGEFSSYGLTTIVNEAINCIVSTRVI